MTSNIRGNLSRLSEYAISVWNNRNRQELLKILPKKSVGAEIGVYTGDFARRLFDTLEPRKLHLIDPWWQLGKKKLGFLYCQPVCCGWLH